MRTHVAGELHDVADILAPDGTTILASGVRCAVTDLSGKRLEQAQLMASETSHLIVFRGPDAEVLGASGYLACYIVVDESTYIVDYTLDPRRPRPGMWSEVYCHIETLGGVS
jgi:hypothetical protein